MRRLQLSEHKGEFDCNAIGAEQLPRASAPIIVTIELALISESCARRKPLNMEKRLNNVTTIVKTLLLYFSHA